MGEASLFTAGTAVLCLCCLSIFLLMKSPITPDGSTNKCLFNASSAQSDCDDGYYCNDGGASLRIFLSSDGEHASKLVQESAERLLQGSATMWMQLAEKERHTGSCTKDAANKTCFSDDGCGGMYKHCSENRNQCVAITSPTPFTAPPTTLLPTAAPTTHVPVTATNGSGPTNDTVRL